MMICGNPCGAQHGWQRGGGEGLARRDRTEGAEGRERHEEVGLMLFAPCTSDDDWMLPSKSTASTNLSAVASRDWCSARWKLRGWHAPP